MENGRFGRGGARTHLLARSRIALAAALLTPAAYLAVVSTAAPAGAQPACGPTSTSACVEMPITEGNVGTVIHATGYGFTPGSGMVSLSVTYDGSATIATSDDCGTVAPPGQAYPGSLGGLSGSNSPTDTVGSDGVVECDFTVTATEGVDSAANPDTITIVDAAGDSASASFYAYNADGGASVPTSCATDLELSSTPLTESPASTDDTCSVEQVVSVSVTGDVQLGITLSEQSPNVTLTPIVLDGDPQTATGSINELTVDDATGSQPGWTVSGQLIGVTALTTLPNPLPADCQAPSIAFCNEDYSGDNNTIPAANLSWTPSLNVGGSTSDIAGPPAITAGGASTLDTSSTICQAQPGNSGGDTLCDAGLSLTVPGTISSGTYVDELQFTLTAGGSSGP